MAESELFGHVKGPSPAPSHNRAGKFELADKGTCFSTDRGLSLALQAKLLRVLQYGDLQRIGDDTPLKVNVAHPGGHQPGSGSRRWSRGSFRADLYHPAERLPVQARRCGSARRHPPAGRLFFANAAGSAWGWSSCASSPGAATARAPRLARQRARAGRRHPPLRRAGAGRTGQPSPTLEPHHFNLGTTGSSLPADTVSQPASPTIAGGLRAATDLFQRQLISRP